MKLLLFLFKNANNAKIGALFVLGALTGVISTFLLYLINSFINEVKDITRENIVIYFFSIIAYIITNILFFRGLINTSQKMMKEIKEDLFSKILNSRYSIISKNKDFTYTSLSVDVNLVSQSLISLIHIIISFSTIVCCFIYMGILSWKLLIVTILVFSIGITLFVVIVKVEFPQLKKIRNIQDDVIELLNEILKGYKELMMYPLKRKEMKDHANKNLSKAYKYGVKTYLNLSIANILGGSCNFVFLGILLLFFPVYFPEEREVIINFALVFLFAQKAIEMFSGLIGGISNAEVSIQKIEQLLMNLNEDRKQESNGQSSFFDFKSIKIKNLSYKYGSENGFKMGPINIELKKNEIIFIHGGNGSGKTTFINTLLGIYSSKDTFIEIDGVPYVNQEWSEIAKNIFAPVFSDFHLFKKNYGIELNQTERVQNLLELFEVDDKVSYSNSEFSTIDLSIGQRKRLALINALLEDRSILVLDEWAADQDPLFRQKFYIKILPHLVKKENKTIIAITHDDHYYNCSDTLYKMEYGNLIKVN